MRTMLLAFDAGVGFPIPHASLFARAKQSGMDRSLDEIPVDTIGVVLVIRQSPADDL